MALYLQRQGPPSLRDAQVLERHRPAASWEAPAMPPAMRLRTPVLHHVVAWHDPWRAWTFARFRAETLGIPLTKPLTFEALYEVPRNQYNAYLQHLAARLPGMVTGAEVVALERPQPGGADAAGGLDVVVRHAGAVRRIRSRFVVLASGLVGFGGAEFRNLPAALLRRLREGVHYSHTHGLEPQRLEGDAGVAVLGGGQSAAEAVQRLLDETEVATIHWIARSAPRGALYPVPYQMFNSAYCETFACLPACERRRLVQEARDWGPTISPPLYRRLLAAPLPRLRARFGADIVEAAPRGNRLCLTLGNGAALQVDHLILGTGYRYDVRRLPLLRPLLDDLELDGSYPVLDAHFLAVPKHGVPPAPLFFTGAAALLRDGPRQLFINSSGYTAGRILAGMRAMLAAPRRRQGCATTISGVP